ncbi:Uncharacterized protein DAT39_020440, partial [Clarias magur]
MVHLLKKCPGPGKRSRKSSLLRLDSISGSIQSDQLLAASSITDQQDNIPDSDGGQRSIDQHRAVR